MMWEKYLATISDFNWSTLIGLEITAKYFLCINSVRQTEIFVCQKEKANTSKWVQRLCQDEFEHFHIRVITAMVSWGK